MATYFAKIQRPFARIQRPSLRWGLIFGIILGIVEAVFNFAASFTDQNTQNILGYIPAVLFLVLGFYAGLRASQETGKWTTSLLAGLWVGLIGTVIADLIPLAYTLFNLQSIVANSQAYIKTHEAQVNNIKPSDYTASDVMITFLLQLVVSIINAAFFTIVGGGLAGFIGRRRALALASAGTGTSVYEEAMFTAPASDQKEELPTPQEEDTAKVEEAEEAEIKDKTPN